MKFKSKVYGLLACMVLGVAAYVYAETISAGGPCPSTGQNIGQFCYRTDNSKLYILIRSVTSLVWTEVLTLPSSGILTLPSGTQSTSQVLTTPTITGGTITDAYIYPFLYDYRSTIQLQDDFVSGLNTGGTTGVLGWVPSGGATNQLSSTVLRPGLLAKSTTAVSGTVAAIGLNGVSSNISPTLSWQQVFVVIVNNNDANTTVRIGQSDNVYVSPIANGIYFEKLDGDTNWFCVTKNGGSSTRVDSGVAVQTANYVSFKIQNLITSVNYVLDGVSVCTISTNIPSATLLDAGLHIVNSAAAVKTLTIDYFQLIIIGLVR